MSKRKRDKASKSSYARQARKQHKAEDMFLLEIERSQEQSDKVSSKSNNRKRSKWDDED
jgi:hypothetical protein